MSMTPERGAQPPAAASTGGVLQPYGLAEPATPIARAQEPLAILGIDHIAIRVAQMARAEAFYHEFFQMDIVLRARRNAEGTWEPLPADYDWDEAIRTGTDAEMVYLRHPQLSIALRAAGRGTIFREPRVERISLRVTPEALATIRAEALVRSFAVTKDEPHSFIFQDPYDIIWHITDTGGAA